VSYLLGVSRIAQPQGSIRLSRVLCLHRVLVCNPSDWQPYNPNAERDARIEAEGLYSDLIHTTFDENDDDPKVASAAPDFDL
jgi:hypothetical protein